MLMRYRDRRAGEQGRQNSCNCVCELGRYWWIVKIQTLEIVVERGLEEILCATGSYPIVTYSVRN